MKFNKQRNNKMILKIYNKIRRINDLLEELEKDCENMEDKIEYLEKKPIKENKTLEQTIDVIKNNLYVIRGILTSEKNQEIQKEIDNYMNSAEKNKKLVVIQYIIDKHKAKQE